MCQMKMVTFCCRLQRDALPLFQMLRQNYKSSIDREPTFNEVKLFSYSYVYGFEPYSNNLIAFWRLTIIFFSHENYDGAVDR